MAKVATGLGQSATINTKINLRKYLIDAYANLQ